MRGPDVHYSGRISGDAHDSDRATHGPSIPALPIALLTSPSGYAGAIGTTPTSAVTVDEGRTDGTSDQSSSDDHAGEARLLATDRQTHPVGHFGIGLVTGALLCPCRPHRSELPSRHGRRICYLDHQQQLGFCPSPCWLQHRHRQMDLHVQVKLQQLFGTVQGSLGPS
jgi:hypothetical protein